MKILIAAAIGFLLDLLFGDPHWLPHPIRLIGWIISKSEKIIRKILPKTQKGQILGGVLINIFVLSFCFFVPYFILLAARGISVYLELALESVFCYQILATKSLKTESMRVYKYLIKKDIKNSRKYLSWIVGRDTENLDETQISKAAVETVAENTSDGVIAPLIFILIGGAPLGFLYKGVNTLDSMIGYKNEKYLYFGKFSAKVDDVFNYIPAIISAWLMIFASFVLRLDYKNAVKIYKRDKNNHSSPNSAKTEAVCAGALDIQLAGDAYYFGKLCKKPTIGDPIKKVEPNHIVLANKLMYTTACIGFAFMWLIRLVVVVMI